MRLTVDVLLDTLVREDRAAVDVDLITNSHVVTQDGDVLKASPAADGAVPADDAGLDPGVVLDLAVSEQDASLETDAIANDDVGSDSHVGTNTAVLANLRGGVDEDVSAVDIGLAGGGEQLGALLGERGEVEAGSAEEVLGLTDVHPETLKVEGVQLAVLAYGREGLLFNGGWAKLDALENAGVEDVDAGVDAVADELDWLLDEAVDAGRVVWLVNYDTVLGGFLDLGDDNGTLVTVGLVEVCKGLEGVFADDVRVEDEEGRVILAQDLLGKLKGAGGA